MTRAIVTVLAIFTLVFMASRLTQPQPASWEYVTDRRSQ
jgi:hypothetical protein